MLQQRQCITIHGSIQEMFVQHLQLSLLCEIWFSAYSCVIASCAYELIQSATQYTNLTEVLCSVKLNIALPPTAAQAGLHMLWHTELKQACFQMLRQELCTQFVVNTAVVQTLSSTNASSKKKQL